MLKNKSILVCGCVLIVFAIMISQRNLSPELIFPKCEINKPVQSKITFYLDESVVYKSEIVGKLHEAVAMSNTILANSCVPIIRSFKESQFISMPKSVSSVSSLHSALQEEVGASEIDHLRSNPIEQYVVVLGENHPVVIAQEIHGMTMMNMNDSFIVLSERFPITVLEHEFGHLAWAMHEQPDTESGKFWVNEQVFPDNRKKVKPYAGAYHCSNYGTVMSYATQVVPAYSSPLISNNGEFCGHGVKGDNTRVMQEYAESLR
ncbi:hypothetical protein L3V35_24000 [Vibrio sp. L5-1]|jgi:hypothetical protein|uniref:Peptidyl-Asp metalloendopeptidase n=1 Tax=Vibrio qingdaonensis TaxID=2829491 RepID=A0A9X3CRI8_9VIBR|nr:MULTISPECIES: hypothetical protein [Vibrio]CAK2481772.1 Peptidyl-Asp metalloendopeptidase [Vibrio crassostreae]MCF7498054.1 hypothetical protein [Vibrio sp. L5-1]MCW8348181.1 hypothetical protein [Vibrio qingdaonensis]CAK2800876.1 Peptidyl-Asp metalloendopeptidase [Vibrio crassostreae]CAK3416949.1 Peptidyl-Asp metalloendopeptidase [Vibrio crassostreae]